MSGLLLSEIDGAYLVRYLDGVVWAWHGGQYVNCYDTEGNAVTSIGLGETDGVDSVDVEVILLKHLGGDQ